MLALVAQDRLAQLQSAFAEAIFFDDAPIPATVRDGSGPAYASRFSVYRNNVIAGLINAIAARYPVVRKLLCDDTFNRIAQRYVTAEPPRSPVLLEYGESFPNFLRKVGQNSSADYLADIAELEAARTRAYHAADVVPLPRDAFNALDPARMAELRLTLHPSLQLLKSRFPVVSIWQAHLYADDSTPSVWQAECALIVRPRLQVEVHLLTRSNYELFSALTERHSLGEAVDRATATMPGFDLAECFKVLISADVVVGLDLQQGDDSWTLSTT
jgi:hypothetical protein